jgi:hypothetical protein
LSSGEDTTRSIEAFMTVLLQGPTTASLYDSLGSTEIRLVGVLPAGFEDPIEVNIKVVDLETGPVYDALSYVWHPQDGTVDPSQPLWPALVNNHSSLPALISANLDAAICHLRPRKSGLGDA